MDANILVVDDEPEIADLVEVYLKSEGAPSSNAARAPKQLACVARERLDLAILDVMLPDISGFTLCGEIRKEHHFPVLMLTAKVDDMDKITGLTIGADDYITKPFNPLELVARVKAQLRRYTRYNEADKSSESRDLIDFNGLVINRGTHECQLYDRELNLTPIEFDILWMLCENRGQVISASACLRRYGERSIWTGTIPLWYTSAVCGRKWASPAGIPGSSKRYGAWGIKSTDFP